MDAMVRVGIGSIRVILGDGVPVELIERALWTAKGDVGSALNLLLDTSVTSEPSTVSPATCAGKGVATQATRTQPECAPIELAVPSALFSATSPGVVTTSNNSNNSAVQSLCLGNRGLTP